VIGTVFALAFVVIVTLLHAYYGRVSAREVQRKVIDEPSVDVARAKAEQLQKIGEYRMIDASKGLVALPIERAMELMVAEQRQQSGTIGSVRGSSPAQDSDSKTERTP
jgi:hypothetical protein